MNIETAFVVDETAPRPEVLERLMPTRATSKTGQPTAEEMKHVRRYNLAIHRLIHGKGSATAELAVLTGLSPKAIERRCYRAEKQCTSDELDAKDGPLSEADRRYLKLVYSKMSDPAVKEFVRGASQVERN